jgi:hypothetical protein
MYEDYTRYSTLSMYSPSSKQLHGILVIILTVDLQLIRDTAELPPIVSCQLVSSHMFKERTAIYGGRSMITAVITTQLNPRISAVVVARG